MRIALLASVLALALAVLWFAGEQHRENCIASGARSCSVLPWDDGERGRTKPYSAEECALLREAAEQPFSELTVPKECAP